MATKKYGVLSVVAHPHPSTVYRDLFDSVARKPARFWGDQFAALSPISKEKDGIFSGRLAIWTEIDRSSNVIDKSELEEISFSESGVNIPREIGFNSKVFSFSFRIYDHLLFIEIQNDEGKHLSINRAQLAFEKILSSSPLKDIEEVIVHVIPVADSVDRVLSLPQIRKVEIRIYRPNPDELDDDVAEILRNLRNKEPESRMLHSHVHRALKQ